MGNTPHIEQGELFLQAGHEEIPREFMASSEGASVPLVEQKLYLVRALGSIAEINEADGFIKAANSQVHQPKLKQVYGRNLGQMVAGKHKAKAYYEQHSEAAFRQAFGTDQMTASGSEEETEALTQAAFANFKLEFFGAENSKKRNDFIDKLLADVTVIQEGFTLKNRQGQQEERERVLQERTLNDLNTDERVEVIQRDPRAGFLPATNKEKNMVLSYLDYLDNAEFPLGVANQLFESMRHTQKVTEGKQYPFRTLESIIYEIGDFYADARGQFMALKRAQEEVSGLRPDLKLSEIDEISEDSLEMATVTRMLDAIEALVFGHVGGVTLHELLKTHTERWASGLDEGKHKQIQDRYTGETVDGDADVFFRDRIKKRYEQMTVAELCAILPHAITDQQLRGRFMKSRLQEVAKVFEQKVPLASLAVTAIEQLHPTS